MYMYEQLVYSHELSISFVSSQSRLRSGTEPPIKEDRPEVVQSLLFELSKQRATSST